MSVRRWTWWSVLAAAALLAGCGDSGGSGAPSETAFERYGLDWVLADDGRYALRANVAIAAPAEQVWALVRDVNAYQDWSKALTAHVDELVAGAPIALSIQLLPAPLPMTDSSEHVKVIDDEVRGVSWGRDFPFDQHSERWQIVTSEGPDASRYYTALVFTNGLGSLMDFTGIGDLTLAAFETFGAELAARSTLDSTTTRP